MDFSNLVEQITEASEATEDYFKGHMSRYEAGLGIRATLLLALAVEHVAERLDKVIELAFDETRALNVHIVE